ncbi:hypothetical protein BDD12DRAFT_875571 [Trichophaea hybrida]|nr:hypothetical protein BDD12DRAFT_875571 [Trichophaea hybrida]
MSRQSQSAKLTWHNTLLEDFTNRKASSNLERPQTLPTTGRKRHSASLEGLNMLMIPDDTIIISQSLTEAGKTSSPIIASPTKRYRTTNDKSDSKTPAKPAVSGKASDSGMQTPPPSSAGVIKKKRMPQRAASTSKIGSKVLSPPPTSPSKLHTSSTSTLNSINSAQRGRQATARGAPSGSDEYSQNSLFCDAGLDLGRGNGEQLRADWNVLRRNLFSSNDGDIFQSKASMNARGVSPVRTDHTASDSAHFSFMQSDHSDFAPAGVDPNLLFSEPSSTASSMVDGFNNCRNDLTPSQKPYHHQNLQRQREREERLKRRQLESAKSREDLMGSRKLGVNRNTHRPGPSASRRTSSNHRNSGGIHINDENAPIPHRGTTISRSRSSPSKISKARAEVVLAIAADGRAVAKSTVVHEPDSLAMPERSGTPSGWDSLEESDSSFDGDSPRGLAPDGGEYSLYRRRRNSALETNPFLTTKSTIAAKPFPTNILPRTPIKPHGLFAIPAAIAGRSRMDSSPRLPTPLKSSPPPLGQLRSHSSIATITPQLPQFEDVEDDESEAETVVDEPVDDDTDGDALTALKKVLARSRGGDVSPLKSSARARPVSSLEYHTYGIRGRSVGTGSLYDPFSSPTKSHASSVQTPRHKPRRRHVADGGFHKGDLGNTSPTTVTDPDCASDRDLSDLNGDDAAGETRCICGGRQDDGGKTMVQCESCNHWSHIKCLGYNRRTLPKVFVCTFCIDHTPQARNRTRGLARVKSLPSLRAHFDAR